MRYTFFALLGDTGGILEMSMLVFGLFLFPVSKHSFVLTAARKLYLVRTSGDSLFNQLENKEQMLFLQSDILTNTEKTEI